MLGGIIAAVRWRDIDLKTSSPAERPRTSPPAPVTPEQPAPPSVSRNGVSAIGIDLALWTNGNLRTPPYIDYEARGGGGMGLTRSWSRELEPLLHLTAATSAVFGGMDVRQPGERCEFSQAFYAFQLDFGPTLGNPAGAFISFRAGPAANLASSTREKSCGTACAAAPATGTTRASG